MMLKGKKVNLRPIKMDDAPRFVKWFNDDEVNRYLNHRSMDLKTERKWIKARLSGKRKSSIQFCITTLEGRHIGATGLENIQRLHKRATFGIIIGDKEYWNKGYGSEAAKLIIDYGFKKLKLHKIDLGVYSYNPRAIKVYKRLGFKVEGRSREHTFWNKKYHDAFLMGILNKEWKNN